MSDQQIVMNISETSPYLNGFCDLKCDYSFYYQLSICSVYPNVASAGGSSLIFTYENNTNGTKHVLYNGIEYNVGAIYLFSPSIHFFDGNLADGELQIIHEAVLGNGLPLIVCIPITASSGSIPNNKGSTLLQDMIINAINIVETTEQEISYFSNVIGDFEKTDQNNSVVNNQMSYLQNQYDYALSNTPQVLNIKNYTLENIIPKSPFFSYTHTDENVNYIVYGMNDAIMVDLYYIELLPSVITPYYTNPTYNTNGNGNIYQLFFNQTGATNLLTTNLSDEIYIDCQPTGSSNEQTNITTSTTTEPPKNSVMFLIYVIFFIFVLFLIYMLFSYITHPDKKNISLDNIKNPFT
jgi:hypothetical protein